jgi:hypothetical protein
VVEAPDLLVEAVDVLRLVLEIMMGSRLGGPAGDAHRGHDGVRHGDLVRAHHHKDLHPDDDRELFRPVRDGGPLQFLQELIPIPIRLQALRCPHAPLPQHQVEFDLTLLQAAHHLVEHQREHEAVHGLGGRRGGSGSHVGSTPPSGSPSPSPYTQGACFRRSPPSSSSLCPVAASWSNAACRSASRCSIRAM